MRHALHIASLPVFAFGYSADVSSSQVTFSCLCLLILIHLHMQKINRHVKHTRNTSTKCIHRCSRYPGSRQQQEQTKMCLLICDGFSCSYGFPECFIHIWHVSSWVSSFGKVKNLTPKFLGLTTVGFAGPPGTLLPHLASAESLTSFPRIVTAANIGSDRSRSREGLSEGSIK